MVGKTVPGVVVVSLTAAALASCQREMNDGAKCPAGTSLERERPSNPPYLIEYCSRDDSTMHGPYLATIEGDPVKRGQC